MTHPDRDTPVVGIVADDLTSAADGAGPFMTKGLQIVVRCAASRPGTRCEADVVSIDCDSRSQNEEKAVKAIAQATEAVSAAPLLYKTIDSTLRGHVKAELRAAFHASGRKHVVIAPAFPSAGRITRGGIQLVDGVPVSETSYAQDPVHPARTSRILDLVPSELECAVILDAETQEELDARVAAIPNPEETLWVGSPGLAIALAKTQTSVNGRATQLPTVSKTLVVVGSANEISRQQLERLRDVKSVTRLCSPLERTASPETVLADLVAEAAHLIATGAYDALIATGGETMAALLDKLNVDEFVLMGEFEPGFPLGVGALPNGKSLILGLKAGGFGTETTLLSAVEALTPSLAQHSKVS